MAQDPKAAIGAYTLADLRGKYAGKGVHPIVVNAMLDWERLLDQALFQQCNDGTKNQTEVKTSFPDLQPRAFNEGVEPVKALSKIVTDSTGMYSSYSQIDVALMKLYGNSATWRAEQEVDFVQGFSDGMARRVFQSKRIKDVKEFDGFGVRFSKPSDQVIDASVGQTAKPGDEYTDIWLINWAKNGVYLIYPEGGLAGLVTTDQGERDVYDKENKRYRAFITDYDWTLGLAVSDPRFVVRIANVNVSALKRDPIEAGINLQRLMIRADERMSVTKTKTAAWYMPQPVREALRVQMLEKSQLTLDFGEIAGQQVSVFSGAPVHRLPLSIIGTYKKKLSV